MGAIKQGIIIAILLTNFLFVILIVKQTKACDCLTSLLFKDLTLDLTNDESKWSLVRTVFMQLAAFVLLHIFIVMGGRILFQKSSPATKEDPTFMKLLNRIITNTLEQSFIFLGLFAYLLFDGPAEKLPPTLVLNLAAYFILGRVLFSAGYIIGTVIGFPQIRGYGVALTIFVEVALVEYIFCKTPCITSYILSI